MGYLVVYSFDDIKSAHFFDTHDDAVDFINETNEDGIAENVISKVFSRDDKDIFEIELETGKTAKIEIKSYPQHLIKYDLSYAKNGSKPITRRFSNKKNAIAYAHKLLEELDADPDPGEDERGEWKLRNPLKSLTAHILLTLVILDEGAIDDGANISDYKILDLKQNATKDDIKTAFRKMALKYHPDNGGDAKKFIEVRKAYERLMNSNTIKKSQKVVEEFRCFDLGQLFEDLSAIIELQEAKLYMEIRNKAASLVGTGVILFAVGMILTRVSYSAAEPGGGYVIFTGLILVGIWDFVKGAYYFLHPKALIKKIKK